MQVVDVLRHEGQVAVALACVLLPVRDGEVAGIGLRRLDLGAHRTPERPEPVEASRQLRGVVEVGDAVVLVDAAVTAERREPGADPEARAGEAQRLSRGPDPLLQRTEAVGGVEHQR